MQNTVQRVRSKYTSIILHWWPVMQWDRVHWQLTAEKDFRKSTMPLPPQFPVSQRFISQTCSETPTLNAVQLLPSWKQHLLVYIMLAHACMQLYNAYYLTQQISREVRGDWRVTIWMSDLRQYWLVISDNIYTLQYTFISTTLAPLFQPIIGNDRP